MFSEHDSQDRHVIINCETKSMHKMKKEIFEEIVAVNGNRNVLEAIVVNSKKGVILGIALIMFLVISIIGISLMTLVMGRARQTNDLEKRTQAYFFARSGVEIARGFANQKSEIEEQYFENKVFVLYGNLRNNDGNSLNFNIEDVSFWLDSVSVRASFEASASSFESYDIVTAVWKDSDYFNFLSSGNAGDMTRTLAFKYSEGSAGIPVFDMAIFADGKIETGASANSKVKGDIGTNSTDTSAISRQNNNGNGKSKKTAIFGDIFFGPGTDVDELDPKDYFLEEGREVRTLEITRDYKSIIPEFPDFPELSDRGSINVTSNESIINDDGYYKKITVGDEKTLTFDTGNAGNVRKIVVDELVFGSSSCIKLSGQGKLNLYVGSFTTKGNSSISINKEGDKKEIDRVVLYYSGSSLKNVDLSLNGTLSIDSASEVTLGQGNNELKISGLIIYGGESNVTMKGTPEAHSIALFAPKAKVIMTGNAEFHGAIVCNEYDGSGGPDVFYENIEDKFTEASLEIISGDGVESFEWGQ